MALKVLMLRKKITDWEARKAQLTQQMEGFEAREAELEASIEEAGTEDEQAVVAEAVEAFEAERLAVETEMTGLDTSIQDALDEIRALEAKQQTRSAGPVGQKGKNKMSIETRTKFFGLNMEQRDAFMAQEEITEFCTRVRQMGGQTRAVSGAELGIPTSFLSLLRDNLGDYSKLFNRVSLTPLKGKARQNVVGTVPEAVWTEAVGVLNELSLSFSQIEMDGYMVGGYIVINNTYLEDDDNLQLMSVITEYLLRAIGKALDKAILYGTGTKMPVGILTRLSAATQPAWWGTNQETFTNLSTSNVLKLDLAAKSGAEFFAALTGALAVAKPNYSDGKATWVMNRKTHMDIMAKALAFNSAAALTAGVNNQMPIVGGDIVELDDIVADSEIIGGYFGLYKLVEREGSSLASSDLPMFIQNCTVFRGLARYDGKPVKGEGFVAVSYDNTAVTTTATFAEDTANAGE